MGRKEQQAVAHLKQRLVKERRNIDTRKKTVSFLGQLSHLGDAGPM